MLRSWLRLCAVLLPFVVLALGARPSAAGDPNPIRALKVEFDQPVRATVASTFTARAQVEPNSGGSPWAVFIWEFGDGTLVDTGRVDGTSGEPVTNVQTHTYPVAGTYTVTCSAYHGYAPIGYRFEKTTVTRVDVVCEDAAPSTKRCGAVSFATFTGTWEVREGFTGGGPVYGTLDLVEAFGRVRGTFDDGMTTWDVGGKVRLGTYALSSGSFPVVRTKLKMTARTPPAAKDDATHATLEMNLMYGADAPSAYRGGPYTLTGGPRGRVDGFVVLLPSTPVPTATVCTQLKAGRARTEPDDFLALVAAVQNEGEANVAGERLVLTIEIEGGTILSDTVKSTRMDQTAGTSRTAAFTLDSLGEGRKGDARASAALVVLVDANASVVKCRLSVGDLDPHDDAQFANANLRPDRVLCVRVVRD
jgi:hypothetical protein